MDETGIAQLAAEMLLESADRDQVLWRAWIAAARRSGNARARWNQAAGSSASAGRSQTQRGPNDSSVPIDQLRLEAVEPERI